MQQKRKFLLILISIIVLQCDLSKSQQTPTITLSKCDSGDHGHVNQNQYLQLPLFDYKTKCTNSTVRFQKQSLNCQDGRFELQLNLTETCKTLPKDLKFTHEGFLILDNNTYSHKEYCVLSHTSDSLSLSICNQTCSSTRPCIRRCCRNGYSWNLSDKVKKCIPSKGRKWKPTFYDNYWSSSSSDGGLDPIYIYSHPGRNPNCKANPRSWFTLAGNISDAFTKAFRVLNDGSVWVKCAQRKYTRLADDAYCIDGIEWKLGEEFPGYSGKEEDIVLIDCGGNVCSKDPKEDGHSVIYGVTLIICSIFFLITAIVYLLLYEKQKIHGWTTFGYLVAMTLNFAFLAVNKFKVYLVYQSVEGSSYLNSCSMIGIIGHYSILSGFTWMTIVNFDIWWTFRALRMGYYTKRFVFSSFFFQRCVVVKSLRRLWIYIALGFIFPGVIVSVGILLDVHLKDDVFNNLILTEYGKHCFIEQDYAILPYFYGPVGVLLSINVLFYLHTIYSLYTTKKSTRMATQNSTKDNPNNESVKLFGKLVFVMGLPWTIEVITWAAFGHLRTFPWYFVLLDILTIGQSILVFFIFVMKKETIKSLEIKYPKFKDFNAWIRSKTVLSCKSCKTRKNKNEPPGSSTGQNSQQTGSTDGCVKIENTHQENSSGIDAIQMKNCGNKKTTEN